MLSLPEVVASPKEIVTALGWTPPEGDTGYVWLNTPLKVGGAVEAGLTLFASCYIDRPDCNVTFELRLRRPPTRRPGALARVDWRPLKGGHTVPCRKGLTNSGKRLHGTHYHPFTDNYLVDRGEMWPGDLPAAVAIHEELQSFESLREWAGKAFGISNIGLVQRPDWRYFLPYDDGA